MTLTCANNCAGDAESEMGKKGGLFRYADGVDKLLLLFGTMGCIGDGLQTPITMFVFGSLIDDYARGSGDSVPKHIIDKYALKLLYISIGVAVCAFVGP
ncbi:ABC transporter B family member 21-like [Arachis ipaensis]|uniref:ABC transporter B family member 21-like n=1 Tax=Arachis ipaensis TaxID=130454 RepID=UPI000A2B4312|nr:ABC transporter B family member 21-like [Arachis ipaensis]